MTAGARSSGIGCRLPVHDTLRNWKAHCKRAGRAPEDVYMFKARRPHCVWAADTQHCRACSTMIKASSVITATLKSGLHAASRRPNIDLCSSADSARDSPHEINKAGCTAKRLTQLTLCTVSVADQEIWKRGARRQTLCQRRRHLSQMHTTNYRLFLLYG